MRISNAFKLIIAVGITETVGMLGAVFTTPSVNGWYAEIIKPAFNPPSWVFGPVWTALYAVMGISLFLVWKQHSNILKNVGMLRIWKIGTAAFYVQLSLNAVWSIIFFGLRSPGGAFVEIIFLWLAILATIVAFYKISKLAAWLLVPYILWVSFAAYLNYSIMRLNPISPVPISTYAPSSHSART